MSAPVDGPGNVGGYSSIALDNRGNPHISYFDSTNENLKYTHFNGSSWIIKRVDIDGDVGMYSSLALDSSGYPHISYYDDTNDTLKYAKMDTDDDGISDGEDNCPNNNNPGQLDTYPPQGNRIGDACDCESDFLCDGDVDGEDLTEFLYNFGRNNYHPLICTNSTPCPGDFTCDADVDGADVTKFLEDFGRGKYDRPCPICDGSAWCSY